MAHAIASSIIEQTMLQKDGRSYVTERHTWDDGRITRVPYLAAAGTNTTAKMTARVTDLVNERIAEDTAIANAVIGDSIRAKLIAFLSAVTDANLRSQVHLTDPEIVAYRASGIVSLIGQVNF